MKVFVTGASGYLGGSVAAKLIARGDTVVGLARSSDKAAQLRAIGIEPLLGSLDDGEALSKGVSQTDATINAANADHFVAIRSLIEAMTATGKTLIHTSGTSIVVDDAAGEYASVKVFADDDVFSPLLHRVPRVAIDHMVRIAGVTKGIRTAVVCPSMVYGKGLGLQTESDQIPKLVKKSKALGHGVYIGKGENVWSNVYINDLADLYLAALDNAPSASFFFAENGESSLKKVAEAISHSLGFAGVVESWAASHAFRELGPFARVALASNSRVTARNARRLLQWRPSGPSLADALVSRVAP